MSKGPGAVQRLILDTLKEHGAFYLAALAGGDVGARYKSLYRAAMALDNQQQLTVITYLAGQPKVTIQHAGAVVNAIDRDAILATSVRLSKRIAAGNGTRHWSGLTFDGWKRAQAIAGEP